MSAYVGIVQNIFYLLLISTELLVFIILLLWTPELFNYSVTWTDQYLHK